MSDDPERRLRWCVVHQEPAWIWNDGSIQCMYDLIVEAETDHTLIELPEMTELRSRLAEIDEALHRWRDQVLPGVWLAMKIGHILQPEENPMNCPARIRPFPRGNDLTVECELEVGHATFHSGVILDYAYPGSKTTVNWAEWDRRNFTGEWLDCPAYGCPLPGGHDGEHVS